MTIYTTPDGDARASTMIIGTLYGATVLLALLAWEGQSSLALWTFGVGAVAIFASLCAAPGWITAFWCAYVRKLPDEQVEEKRHSVNVVAAWLAVIGVTVGAVYVFRPHTTSHWTEAGITLAIAVFVGYMFAQYCVDEIKRLRWRCDCMERRIDQLEQIERALESTIASVSDRFDDNEADY